uniref:Large ribosomal subunit protein eL31 n=1 Tax=uncultured marine thaumarchaeote KM3_198_G09 TaxID=1456089 RepID=A0A075GXN1_9ARCH|nr:ribosomal protein L31e (RP-L31e, RPL31) [uncultured marine thaumarchaeote KM3_198_G09]
MSQDVERVYTVNLGKVLLSPDNQRAKRAVNMIKEFARHHLKIEQVKLEEDVSHLLWARGIKHPPRKIRVRMTKTDEGYVLVSKYEGEEESIEKEEEKTEPQKVEPPKVEPEKEEQSLKVEPEAKPEPEPEPAAKPEAKPEPKPAAKPEAKPEPKPAAKPEAKPEPKPAAKPEPEPAAKPEAKPEPEPAAKLDDVPEFFKKKDEEIKKKPKSKSKD